MYCNWVVSGIVSNVYSIPASHEKEEGGGTVARGLSSTRSVAQLNPSSSAQPASQQPLCNQLSRSTTISIASIPITSLLKRKVAIFFRCVSISRIFVPPRGPPVRQSRSCHGSFSRIQMPVAPNSISQSVQIVNVSPVSEERAWSSSGSVMQDEVYLV